MRVTCFLLLLCLLVIIPAASAKAGVKSGIVRDATEYVWSGAVKKINAVLKFASTKAAPTASAIGRSAAGLLRSGKLATCADDAMKFVWRNKGALAVTTTLGTFVTRPEVFIEAGKDVAAAASESVKESSMLIVPELLQSTGDVVVLIFAVATIAIICMVLLRKILSLVRSRLM